MVSTITGMLGPLGTPGVRHDRIVSTPERLCPMCKRVQRLSGEERCAIHVKAATLAAHHKEFDTKPFGPIAPLDSFQAGNSSVDDRIEKAFYDGDLVADDAVLQLYRNGVLVTRIQRAFSLGMFGDNKRRKLVPTRWSITAVDSNLSLRLMARVRQHPLIDEYRVYKYTYLDNTYVGILTPDTWRFEWIEAWFEPDLLAPSFPDVNMATDVENSNYVSPDGHRPVMLGDSEGFRDRKTYAKPGGCYYSARLAVSEYLDGIGRQAGAIMLREIHPGYIMPVGVWEVRERLPALL